MGADSRATNAPGFMGKQRSTSGALPGSIHAGDPPAPTSIFRAPIDESKQLRERIDLVIVAFIGELHQFVPKVVKPLSLAWQKHVTALDLG